MATNRSGRYGPCEVPERAIRRAKSLKERSKAHCRSMDGAADILVGCETTSSIAPFKLLPGGMIMLGIRERISDLRRRALSDPARLEAGTRRENLPETGNGGVKNT